MNFNQQNNPYKQIFKSLKSIYSNKESTYRDIRDYIAPGTGLFDGSVNKANVENDKIDYQKILDSEPTTYMKLTVAGLYGGLVNPASRWFDLVADKTNKDYQNMDMQTVSKALEYAKEFLYYLLARSNFYPSIYSALFEWIHYGVGVMLVEERDYDFIFFNPLTVGEYYLGIDGKGRYTKLAREFSMTADQMLDNFPKEVLPERVIERFNAGDYETLFQVKHLICENPKDGLVSNGFKYIDLYWTEEGGETKLLRKSGYYSCPIVVFELFRKNLRTIYPMGFGEQILGDVKELQYTVKCLNLNKSYLANPALALHTDLGRKPVLPGARFYTDQDPTKVASEIFRVSPHITELEDSRTRLLDKIRKMTMADLLMIFAQQNKGNMTAREVTAIANEQMTLLAPIYLQAKNGLQAIFDRVIDICVRRGAFPEVDGINYKDINIEFLSSIAKAQRMAEVGSIEDLILYISQLAQVKPASLDYINEDEIVIDIAQRLGNMSKIRSREEVEAMRQAQAEQQQALMQQELQAQQMKVAKDASKAKIEPNNLLGQQILQQGGQIPEDPHIQLEREKTLANVPRQ